MSSNPEINATPVYRQDQLGEIHSIPVYLISPPRRRLWLHLLLFLLTIFTTLVIGARLSHNFYANQPAYALDEDFFPWKWALSEPSRLLAGIPFSLTLMLILLAHEMGHYIACLRYRVYATLPFFVPAPTLIGTLGAFIRIKSPIQSRRALFDIGIAGPIAGFVLAVPAMIVGLLLSKHAPELVAQSQLRFNSPVLFRMAGWLSPSLRYPMNEIAFHPVAFAAWIGLFMTALNLLPGGQLDGGHIIYAVWPRWHRLITRATIALLVPLGIFYFYAWLIWAGVLLAFSRHPKVPESPGLGSRRIALAVFALCMFVFAFHFNPIVLVNEPTIWDRLVRLAHRLF
jgi:membrane-associated protease RseP (regulator of RpoE activity)